MKQLFILAVLIMNLSAISHAQIPRRITYQGVLSENGTPVNSTKSITFRIYDVSSGGSALWGPETHQVSVSQGLFTVILGSLSSMDALAFDKTYYLSIDIGGTEITRVQLTSVGYAISSLKADYATSAGTASGVSDNVVTSSKIADGTIVDADISSSATIAGSKISPNFGTQVITGNGSGITNVSASNGVPVGTIIAYAGTSVPSGWLVCDGSSQSTSTFAVLFAAVGYTYGGSGSNFSLPDLKGRVAVGDGQGSGLTNRTIGQKFGEENHTLTSSESGLPSHDHPNSLAAAGHTHSEGSLAALIRINADGTNTTQEVSTGSWTGNIDGNGGGRTGASTGESQGAKVTGSTGSSSASSTAGNSSSQNASQSHNVMQPSLVIKYIIKAQ